MSVPGCEVSVVIPTRGRPELLRRAVSSALAQTCGRLEVIVVLDGEDEGTETMLAAMDDGGVRLVKLAISVGGSEARNTGARAAAGKYIALLDDDDEWLPDKLARQLASAHACSSAAFVVVTQYLYRLGGQPDEVWPGHLPGPGEPLSEFLFSSCGGFQTSTYLCPRELFLRVPFTAGLKKHQDWDWFLRLAALPEFELLVVDAPLSIYWVPLRTRASVSGTIDWRFSQTWARSRLSLMTRKAYGMFLVKICARSAAAQMAGWAAVWEILRELVLVAQPTPLLLGEFAAAFLVPADFRARLRTMLRRSRKSDGPKRQVQMAVPLEGRTR